MKTSGLKKPCLVKFCAIVATIACSQETTPGTETLLPDSVSAAIYGFVNNYTSDGVLRAVLTADSAYQYQDREEWNLFDLEVEFRSETGSIRSTLTADHGTYNLRTSNMEARDNVVAVTPDGRRLTTCALEYIEMTDLIRGPCDFVYDAPNDHMEGASFEADPDFQNVTTIEPRDAVIRDPGRGN